MADKKEFMKELSAGAFFLFGLAAIFIFILTIGRDKGLTQSKFQVTVLFQNVAGLNEGAPVRLSGVNIGTVSAIDFLKKEYNGRNVQVVLNVFDKYKKQLDIPARFTIKTEGLLGEKLVEIYDKKEGENTNYNEPIVGEDPFDVQDLAVTFAGAAESFTKTANELSKIDMVNLTNVIMESSESLLMTSQKINEITDDLQEVTVKSKRVLDRVEQKLIDGNLFKVF
jgi:phospholipid/cholesterol/gamma-HCH transport system substrate-binding protein